MKSKYTHKKNVHNLKSPNIIVDELLKHFSPNSIVDIGCGLGTFVKSFQDHGVAAIGVDGSRVDKSKLFIDPQYFIEKNLEQYHDFQKKYDLAVSLEVAEHLSPESAENFVRTLISCSDYIIFSAAIPGQGGQNHINEQAPEYREKLFNQYDYEFHDVFRHVFWNNEKIFRWYKQNMFLATKKGSKIPYTLSEKSPRYIIHPELYNLKNFTDKNIYYMIKHIGYILYTRLKSLIGL